MGGTGGLLCTDGLTGGKQRGQAVHREYRLRESDILMYKNPYKERLASRIMIAELRANPLRELEGEVCDQREAQDKSDSGIVHWIVSFRGI